MTSDHMHCNVDLDKATTATLASTSAATMESDDDSDSQSTGAPFACGIAGCQKQFRRRFTLKEHAKTHTGEKNFACPVRSCRKSFATSGNLARHKRTQHSWLDTPLLCLVDGCGCSFSSEAKLERHMAMVHFGASSHPCRAKHCGRAFSTSGNLRRHLRNHHGLSLDGNPSTMDFDKKKNAVMSPSSVSDDAMEGRDSMELEPTAFVAWSAGGKDCGDAGFTPTDAELLETLICLFD